MRTSERTSDRRRTDTVTVARTESDVEAMRDRWQTFELATVHHDIDFYLAKVRSRPGIVRPHTILVERDDRPAAIAIGRLENTALECKIGYRTVYRPTLRVLVMRPGVLLHADAPSDAGTVVAELVACLAAGEADAASFYGLDVRSDTYSAVRRLPPAACRAPIVARERHWRLALPESLDAFLASRSRHARSELRGLDRRLSRSYGDRLSIRIFRAPNELDRVVTDIDRVAARTYQRALRVASATDPQYETTRLALERGWFRAYVLYIDDEPVAYRSGFLYKRMFTGSQAGYDPAFRRDGVGTYLLLKLIEDLCADEQAQVLDFGCGNADEKRRFASSATDEAHPYVFAPTFRGVRANVATAAIWAANDLAERALARAGILGRARRHWRNKALVTESERGPAR